MKHRLIMLIIDLFVNNVKLNNPNNVMQYHFILEWLVNNIRLINKQINVFFVISLVKEKYVIKKIVKKEYKNYVKKH